MRSRQTPGEGARVQPQEPSTPKPAPDRVMGWDGVARGFTKSGTRDAPTERVRRGEEEAGRRGTGQGPDELEGKGAEFLDGRAVCQSGADAWTGLDSGRVPQAPDCNALRCTRRARCESRSVRRDCGGGSLRGVPQGFISPYQVLDQIRGSRNRSVWELEDPHQPNGLHTTVLSTHDSRHMTPGI